MKGLKKLFLGLDSIFENLALLSLVVMIIIVTLQVFTRKLFNFVFFWSEEITLVLLCWFSFMGIALGFREKLHLAIDSFTNKLPASVNKVIDKVVLLSTIAFGYFLLTKGWDFTVLMAGSTLPATKMSNSWFYAVMPLTGLMIIIYSGLQLFGIETRRHKVGGGGH